MNSSSAVHQLQLDQEITSFSLSLTKNLLARTGIAPIPLIRGSSIQEETMSPIYANNSNATSPYTWKLRLSNERPSYMTAVSFDNYGSPTKGDLSLRMSISENPEYKRQESSNMESPIKIITESNMMDTVGNTISCFTDNFGSDEYLDIIPSVPLVTRQEFSSRLVKEGFLHKKATNIFVGWQKRYFEVKPFKICYAKSAEMVKANQGIRSINLHVHRCEVTDIKGTAFSIKVEGIHKKIKLKADTLREAIEWVDFFKEMFAYAKTHGYQNDKYLNQEKTKLYKGDNMTEEDFLKQANTGDLLLFKRSQTHSKMHRKNSLVFDRISLLVKIYDDLYLYDAANQKGAKTHLKKWKDFKAVRSNLEGNTIVYRKLHLEDKATRELIHTRLYQFLMEHNETKYDPRLDKTVEELVLPPDSPRDFTVKSALSASTSSTILPSSPLKSSPSPRRSPVENSEKKTEINTENFSSAHLVALAYKYVGLLDAHTSIGEYLPMSFSKKIQLLKGAHLSGEYELALLN